MAVDLLTSARYPRSGVLVVAVTALWLVITYTVVSNNSMYSRSEVSGVIKERISAKVARRWINSTNPLFLGNGYLSSLILNSTINEAQHSYHRLLTTVEYDCRVKKRFGRGGDGGYWVCLDGHLQPQQNNCLVYSFGVNNEWSFDEAMNDNFGCEVHSFDPSMNQTNHMHREPNIYFHNLGLSGSNYVDGNGWHLKDLSYIIEHNNHRNIILDILKVDIEGAEWPFLLNFVQSGMYKQVRQLIIEAHTPVYRGSDMTLIDYAEAYDTFETLPAVGINRFLYQTNNDCCLRFAIIVPEDVAGEHKLCCHEQFFVNSLLM